MRWIKVVLYLGVTIALIWFLNNRQQVSGIALPPLGKFLNPISGYPQNAETPRNPALSLEIYGDVSGQVQVLYDSLLIPHIFADSDYDLYYAQGYITAQHRLWQMEFQTHFASGRISEIIGSSSIEIDKLNRRLGFVEAAKVATKNIMVDSFSRTVIEAYTAGVNSYISSLNYKDLPFEYKLLDYRPELWTPEKSGLLLIFMGNSLTSREYDVANTNLLKFFGKEAFDRYFPDYPDGIDPVIPSTAEWNEPTPVIEPDSSYYLEYITEELPMSPAANGSNNWAVSGEKTQNGHPILANDPHLSLNLPSIWFMNQLEGPDHRVMGVSLPGAPGVIIGFNDSIAWGVTNGSQDVKDWYAITFKDNSQQEYLYEGEWLKTQLRVETIKVRGEGPVIDSIYSTHHGPIVYQSESSARRPNIPIGYALRWTLHMPGKEMNTFLGLNRAKNHEDYSEALEMYNVPAQNFVFASNSGDIAIRQQGNFPLRFEDQGKYLMNGSLAITQWQGRIPNEDNPMILNPERQFVSSANQIPVDSNYPYPVFDNGFEDYRNRRINNRLSELSDITTSDMQNLQLDNFNLKAAEIVPYMLDSLDSSAMSTQEFTLIASLREWDYEYTESATLPVFFEIWWDTLQEITWEELDLGDLPTRTPDGYRTIQLYKEAPNDTLFDLTTTPYRESAYDLFNLSFHAAAAEYQELKEEYPNGLSWGQYKVNRINHLTRQSALSSDILSTSGNYSIVNATGRGHGPSWRMVVEMKDSPVGYGVYPGGQSGNPGSHFYDNMIERWRTGDYIPIQLWSTSTEATFQQTITPNQ